MSEYLILLLLTVSIPLLYSFEKRVQYFRKWPALFKAIFLTLIPFIIWDIHFTHLGIWHFNHSYTGSMVLAGLPLEEWLFFIIIPYSCLYIYMWVCYFRNNKPGSYTSLTSRLLGAAGMILLLLALQFHEKSYSLVVFGSLGFILILIRYLRPVYLVNFLITFLIVKIPFFIVNGYLTSKPIVLYNNQENLGIRILTIPIEDVFYNFLLLLINVTLFEIFLRSDDR
ncbi:MAG: lycopene cyclase domain-containing protein [Balneolaceae bacterium]